MDLGQAAIKEILEYKVIAIVVTYWYIAFITPPQMQRATVTHVLIAEQRSGYLVAHGSTSE
jgi:hypothetical protein